MVDQYGFYNMLMPMFLKKATKIHKFNIMHDSGTDLIVTKHFFSSDDADNLKIPNAGC